MKKTKIISASSICGKEVVIIGDKVIAAYDDVGTVIQNSENTSSWFILFKECPRKL
jgi:hypothetical protein